MTKYTLTISVAKIPIKLIFKEKVFFSEIKRAYQRFLTDTPVDLSLEVEITDPEGLKESFGPGLLSREIFACSEETAFDGRLNLKKKKGKLLVSKKEVNSSFSIS